MKTFLTILLLCLATQVSFAAQAVSAAQGDARDRVALVIGNADYKSKPLANPVNDARDMAKALKQSGFDVSLITDADQEKMEFSIRAFGKKLNGNSVGLFYYSGHGVQYEGNNYLIPVGAMARVSALEHLRYKTVNVGYALGVMKQGGSDLNIVVLDACRDSPFESFSKSLEKGLTRVARSEGALIAYATAPDDVALDGNGRNSLYTKQLLKHIQESPFSIELMLKAVREAVKSDTDEQQIPWYEASIGGNFYFRRPSVEGDGRSESKRENSQHRSVEIQPLPQLTKADYANWRALQTINAHYSVEDLSWLRRILGKLQKKKIEEKAICGANCIAFAPDGRTVLSGGWDRTLKLWDVASGKAIRTFQGHLSAVWSVAFSPDGRSVLSGGWDNTLKLWDATSDRAIRSFEQHSRGVSSVAFAPDGRTMLSGSHDNTLKLWDIASDLEIRTFQGHSAMINDIAFSPDGRTVLSGSDDKKLKLWDVASGKEIRTFQGDSDVYSVAFSPDGYTVLSGEKNGSIRLWDVASGKKIRTFRGHSGSVVSIAFSPDGGTVLSGSRDNTLKLWNVANGEAIRTLEGHSRGVTSVAFSPDGQRAASGDWDGVMILWGAE